VPHAGPTTTPTLPPELARLVDKHGDLAQMPVKEPLRMQLLTWIASTLPDDRELTEIEVNAALHPIHADVAMLRRYLVDYRLVERPRPGVYRVASAA
jgi:hypothetical protein